MYRNPNPAIDRRILKHLVRLAHKIMAAIACVARTDQAPREAKDPSKPVIRKTRTAPVSLTGKSLKRKASTLTETGKPDLMGGKPSVTQGFHARGHGVQARGHKRRHCSCRGKKAGWPPAVARRLWGCGGNLGQGCMIQ